ncbi:hypothetical protein [Motiliproteus sp.]|uniref:hypothetical protein n=1 Tax=Motiliproteus sp. TaxID=1898955 RepID=UPI003BAA358B
MLARRPLLLIAALMLLPLIWLAVLAWPEPGRPATTELVRLRNALLIEPSAQQDFDWLPKQRPTDFLVDSTPLPPPMQQWLAALPPQPNDWQQILSLSEHLRAKGPSGGALQASTLVSFERITRDGIGYCADYIQVINALAQGAGIPVREWGMSFDGFGGWGHAFSEFYSQHLDQWVFVDVFNGFYVTLQDSDSPLSVQQLQQQLHQDPAQLQIHRLKQGRFGMKSDQVAIDYYLRGKDQFYLWWGTNPLTFDRHPLISTSAVLSRSAEQMVALLLDIHPRIRVNRPEDNASMVAQMLSTKYQLWAITLIEVVLALAFLIFWYRSRKRSPSKGLS